MQGETAEASFLRYGGIFQSLSEEQKRTMICQPKQILALNSLSQFFSYSCDTYIEVQSGSGVLLVSETPETATIEAFSMNRCIRIKPQVYFGFVATTPELNIHLYVQSDYQMDAVMMSTPYEYHPVLPRIRLQNIIGYYYHVKTPGYRFKGEKHPFFELIYVDSGVLYTQVEGTTHRVREKEMILYGPGQFHSQYTDTQAASYTTILFYMENTATDFPSSWFHVLTDRVFSNSKKIDSLIKTIGQESSTGALYADSIMQCLLTEIVIRMLQNVYTVPVPQPPGTARQRYQEDLFSQILIYMEGKIYEPLTVADVCRQFSLSRSTLQHLFKDMVNQSPKKYISDMKLEKGCQMLRQNKYTISEISLKLGYSSIHYFSNAFHQKYHISPSEYAKGTNEGGAL